MWQVSNADNNVVYTFRTELEADKILSINPEYSKMEVDFPDGKYTQLLIRMTVNKDSILPKFDFKTLIVDHDYRPEVFVEEVNGVTTLKAYIYYLNGDYNEAFKEVFTTLLTPLYRSLKSQALTRIEKSQKIITAFASIAEDRLDDYCRKRKGF